MEFLKLKRYLHILLELQLFSSFIQIIFATLCLAASVFGAPRRYYHQRRYYKTQRQPFRGYTASAQSPFPQISYENNGNSLNTQRNSASDLSPKVSFESYGNGGNSYYILRGASKFVKTKEQGNFILYQKSSPAGLVLELDIWWAESYK